MQPERQELEAEVRDLAVRVARIERELGLSVQPRSRTAALTPDPLAVGEPESPIPSPGPLEPTALLPLLGRALLGLAGAYLLRAVTESGTVAPKIGVAVGLLYALFWLVLAARAPDNRRIETALHSLTSVLVLAPLLWEAALRFHAVSTWMAGAILLSFTVFGLAVSWRKHLLIVATIATLAGLGTAAALLLATHDVVPFTLVFLAIAAAVEGSACMDHWLSERWLAATAADLSVLLATWLVTNPRGLPPAYAPIPHAWLLGAQVALLAIYLASTIFRTLLRGVTFTSFETAQCAIAFLIAIWAGVGTAMAFVTLACSSACYLVAFVMLDRPGSRGRNFYTYSTFAILLALVGTRILLSGLIADTIWILLAVGCVWAGVSLGRMTLQLHGAIYLLLALVSSGAIVQAASFLLGEASWPGTADAALLLCTAAAAICYRVCGSGSTLPARGLRLMLAAILAWLLAGVLAGFVTAACSAVLGASDSRAYCATLRTSIVSGAALLLAWGGTRWNNLELSRLIYPAMALGAYRLLTSDLHQDRKAALFFSLLVYGSSLIALPRLRKSRA